MKWVVYVRKKVKKQYNGLPEKIKKTFFALITDIELYGPVRGNWPNFSWLHQSKCYHCHIKKGKPNYVAMWEVTTKTKKHKDVEVIYVGTREDAPY